jgi:hypothetical protein
MFRSLNYVPTYFHWHDPSVRTTPAFTIGGMTRMYFWYLFRSPRAVFDELFGWKPWTAYRYILASILRKMGLSRRRTRGYIRDVFLPWNREWVKPKAAPSDSVSNSNRPAAPAVPAGSTGD